MYCMNDLPAVVTSCTINLYADDTTIYFANRDPDSVTYDINNDLQLKCYQDWIQQTDNEH